MREAVHRSAVEFSGHGPPRITPELGQGLFLSISDFAIVAGQHRSLKFEFTNATAHARSDTWAPSVNWPSSLRIVGHNLAGQLRELNAGAEAARLSTEDLKLPVYGPQ